MINITSVIGTSLLNFESDFPEDRESLMSVRSLLQKQADATDRTNFLPGHITASAALIRQTDNKVLLIESTKFSRLLFPGGHCELGELPHHAAQRELGEECAINRVGIPGTTGRAPAPLHIDVHKVHARPAKDEPEHLHFDFCFHFSWSGDGEVPRADPTEAKSLAWVSLDELHDLFPIVATKLHRRLRTGAHL